MGWDMANVRKIQHVGSKVAQQPNIETCKNANFFAIVAQWYNRILFFNVWFFSLFSHYFIIFLPLPFISFFLLSLLLALSSSNPKTLPSSLSDQHGGSGVGGSISFCGGDVEVVSRGRAVVEPWWNCGDHGQVIEVVVLR